MHESHNNPMGRVARPARAVRPAPRAPLGLAGVRPFVPPRAGRARPAVAEAPRESPPTPAWLSSLDEDHGEPGVATETVAAADAMLAHAVIGNRDPAAGPSEADRRHSFAAAIAAAEAFGTGLGAGAAHGLAEAARALSEAIASGGLATFGEPASNAAQAPLTPG